MLGIRKLWPFVGIVALLLTGLSATASAHSPYTEEVVTLRRPDGRRLRLERLYGDGIFFADPVRGQLRDERGAIVAWTPVGRSIASYCPDLERCWMFVARDAFPETWRVALNQVDWNAPVGEDPYPEYDQAPPRAFARDRNVLLALLGTATIIGQSWRLLAIVIGAWFAVVYLVRWAGQVELPRRCRLGLTYGLAVLLWSIVLPLNTILILFMVIMEGFPALTLFVTLVLVALLRRILDVQLPPIWRQLRPAKA